MRSALMLTALMGVWGFTGPVQAAQTLASPAIFGSFSQTTAVCTIGNSGATAVAVEVHIYDESGNIVSGSGSCSSIEPHFICSIAAAINFGVAYACSATTPGSTKKLRGALVLEDADGVLLRSAELQ